MIKLRDIPYDKAAEYAVIGSIILDSQAMSRVIEHISEDDFVDKQAKEIFKIAKNLWKQGKDYDAVVIRSEFNGKKDEELLFRYLVDAMDNVPSSANAVYYADAVRRKSIERKLCTLIQHGAMALENDGLTTEEKISEIASMAKLSREFSSDSSNQTVSDMIRKLSADLTDNGLQPISTGFNSIDRLIGGLMQGQMILIAGPSSMGKTSLLTDIFIHTARIGQQPYYYYLEMLAAHLAQRLVMNIARVSREQVDPNSEAIRETLMLTDNWPAWIEKNPSPDIDQIVMKISAKKSELDIGIVFIDHIHKIKGKGRNEIERLSYISNALSLMSCELKIPVVCAAQLSRSIVDRDDHTPRMSDLRGCGMLENDARVVMILHRDDYYREQKGETDLDGMANLYVLKSSEGKKGIVNLVWLPEFCSFADASFVGDDKIPF